MSISLHHLVKLGVDVGGEVDTHIGSTGITNCGPCSGGQKVRDIGGSPEAAVLSENVTVPAAGQHTCTSTTPSTARRLSIG